MPRHKLTKEERKRGGQNSAGGNRRGRSSKKDSADLEMEEIILSYDTI